MSFLYPLTMICFGIYIGTYNNCKPAIEYIHEVVISLCSDPNKRPEYKQKRQAQVQTQTEADEDDEDIVDDEDIIDDRIDDEDDIPSLKPIFE